MALKKASGKRWGRLVRPPRRLASPDSSSSDDGADMGTIRAIIACLKALEKEKKAPPDGKDKGVPSGVPTKPKKLTRGTKKVKLMQALSDRWSALEADRPGPTPAPVDLTHEKEGSMPKLDVSGGDGCEAGNTGTEGKSEPVMGSGAAAVATRYRDGQSSVQGACCCCFSSPAPKLDKLGARSMSMRQLLVLCFSMEKGRKTGRRKVKEQRTTICTLENQRGTNPCRL
ncbi:uncharacterized protein LOC128328567 isoform X2 [Hemicordylus capensis]|uniref:uncharacterized protein LOC128328567 isoform X2 n=1 Tax=Hemicordylus capensis TaxID=884348 RepID=UPI0023030657|nr:uncharacterized protein LOC128328567 isoform X2 [Hemicordylus capensis]